MTTENKLPREIADRVAQVLGRPPYPPLVDAIEAALNAERERCARAICLFCAEPKHYGPPKKIEGSKRLWHGDLRNDCNGVVQCQAAAIFEG